MLEDRFLKRLSKKARNGLRGWPVATIAFYGPNLSQATKVAVGIVPSSAFESRNVRPSSWVKLSQLWKRATSGSARVATKTSRSSQVKVRANRRCDAKKYLIEYRRIAF